ncbi:SDR family NAD(P)-dependent oxidoreductase [Variovorax paradoxus]|nr:SDR family NAD(P)-dependent oxidoreductase [Variovorax paradoxus]MDR6455604.1 NAD(P)-dependent dehydrogenase (short-subunit alcohol dehydrogenase family) [Variovorax paradoxus]
MTAKFGATSTADDVLAGLDLKGKRVLVTGTSSGLGLETARALVAHGADVVGTARDLDKAHAATAAVRAAAATSGSFELIELDLGSLGSVGACTDRLLFQAEPFDVVIANAGVMATHYGHTADGFETQMGTNHLGHFVLVNRLAPLLPGGSRVVVLSSNAHRMSDVDLEDLNYERRTYDGPAAYGQSKTANALFAVEFDRRHKDRGIRAVAVHPGVINTGLTRNVDVEMLKGWMAGLNASRAQQRLPPFEFLKAQRRRSGRLSPPPATRSAAGTARIAMSRPSSRHRKTMASREAIAPMPWMQHERLNCGARAKIWSASATEPLADWGRLVPQPCAPAQTNSF